jgi:hypothetical protein
MKAIMLFDGPEKLFADISLFVFQMKVELKNQDIANLGAKVDQLENIRHQQASELENLSKTTKHIEQSREEAAANAAAMAEELNRIKFALNDVTRRQKEVGINPLFTRMPFSSVFQPTGHRLAPLVVASEHV